jgi:peptidoglycan/LPS O-acetylase OafA/YrhL
MSVALLRARPRLAYVPGLDGLRALAVGAVLLYHHDPRLLPGGFLGVELFFVLSGYLITALLTFEWRAQGTVALGDFWLRRARRLLPALLALVAACLLVAATAMPEELAQLRGDAVAALLYMANWRLILDERPYFASFGRPSLLLHLWSLAIEEQFYLLWPPALALGLWRGGRRPILAVAVVGALAAAALMAALARPDGDLSRVYYGTDTRAAGLLVGAALALAWPPRLVRSLAARRAEPWRDLLGLGAIGTLIYILVTTHEFVPWLYQGGFLLVDLAAAAAIVAVARPGARVCRALLGVAPLRWVGERSYSIYLWHWPVFMLTRPGLDVPLESLLLIGLRLGVTLALAELSFRLVETPVRRGDLGQAWAHLCAARGSRRVTLALRWVASIGLATGLAVWIGVAAASAPPPLPPEDALAAAPAAPASPLIRLPTVAALAPTTAPPPLAITPIADAPVPLFTGPGPHEPPAPLLARASPARTHNPRAIPVPVAAPAVARATAPRSALAVGDSIMRGAARALGAAIPGVEVDAAVSRQIGAMIRLLATRRDEGRLAEVVVVHIGNNGYASPERVDELLTVLADVPRVVLVNTAVPRAWAGPNNATLAAALPAHPNAVLVDWSAASAGRYELFWGDGVHLRPSGAALYAALIAEAAAR